MHNSMRLLRFSVLAAALAACLMLVVAPARAQEAGLRASVVSIGDAGFPNARLVLNVEDDSPEGLPPLGAQDFTVTLNGNATAVVGAELASSQNEPLDLLLVIDTSGSMQGAPIAGAKEAAKALVQELAPNDRVAVISFSDAVTVVQDYTADRGLVAAAVDTLVARGNTALYQATAVSAYTAVSSTATRKAVVLLSDGADYGGASIATREEALGAAQTVGVPYFTVAQGTDLDLPYLQQLADVTRGRLLQAPNPQDLRDLYLSIGRLLRNQYIVSFDARTVATLRDVAVRVEVRAGQRSAVAETLYTPAPDFVPPVVVSGIDAGDTVDGKRTVTVTLGEGQAASRISFFIDDAVVADVTDPPYTFTFDPAKVTDGDHTLRVAVDLGGEPVEASVSFTSVAPATSSGAGLPIPLLAGAGAAAGALLLLLLTILRRVRRRRGPRAVASERTLPWAQKLTLRGAPEMHRLHEDGPEEPVQEDIGEPLGVLISRGGSDAGREYQIGGTPVSIGSGARCGVRIDDPDLSAEEARAWVRSGHLMLHRFTRLTAVSIDGTVGGWVILEPGDTFQIGQHTFEFRMLEQPAPAPSSVEETGGEPAQGAMPAAPSWPSHTAPGLASASRPPGGGDGPNVLRDHAADAPGDASAGDIPNVLRDRGADDETSDVEAERRRLRLTEMMPSDFDGRVEDDLEDTA